MDAHEVDGLVGYLIQGAFASRSVASGERLLDWLHSAPGNARIENVGKPQSCMVSKSALDLQENVLKPFAVAEGDLLTHLNVYRAFVDQPEKKRASWAGRHQLNYRVLQRALAIRAQLARFLANSMHCARLYV